MNIPYDARRNVYKDAIELYGEEAQLWMVVEEMSELVKEICKYVRGKRDPAAAADEIADATIMLEQAKLIFDVDELVDEHVDRKILRLRRRIEQGSVEK